MRSTDVTALLREWHQGEREAYDQIFPLIYQELHRLSQRYLRNERPDHTLQATALIHEAYLRLGRGTTPDCANRAHFIGIAARAMRQILVEHARAHAAAKRAGAGRNPPPDHARDRAMDEVLNLHEALDRFSGVDERKARMLELHYFGGLTLDELAESLGLSVPTIVRSLRFGKAWLSREMKSCQTTA